MPNNQSSCANECCRHGEKTAALYQGCELELELELETLGYFAELELELE